MANDFVAQQLAAIAAKRAAALAAQPAPEVVETPPEPAAPPPTPSADAAPARPANCTPEAWDAMPPNVQALVALGPRGQAVQINPPEAAAGLVASASEQPDAIVPAEAPQRRRGRPPKSATAEAPAVPAPIVQTVDLSPVVEAIQALRVSVEAQTAAQAAAHAESMAKMQELLEGMFGAAQILAGQP